MGKFYEVHGEKLYFLVTGEDDLIDVSVFQSTLDPFNAESRWKIAPKIAICNVSDKKTLSGIEKILRKNGYKKAHYGPEALENYFLQGEGMLLGKASRRRSK